MLGYPMNISVGKYLSILKLGIKKIKLYPYKILQVEKIKIKIITKTIGLQIDEYWNQWILKKSYICPTLVKTNIVWLSKFIQLCICIMVKYVYIHI